MEKMLKGGNRQTPVSNKTQLSDSKKSNQDAAGGKQWPRGSRRREPAGGTCSTKPDTSRKPQPQKSRALDKRPRSRGIYIPENGSNYSGPAGSTQRSAARLDEDLEPELGSVFVQGSKKQSLNHLLNFHYTPRETRHGHNNGVTGRSPNGHTKWLATGKHKYNKEHFIQANCQFIVNSSGDYKQYLNNPDALVDWSLIEQINLQVNENPSCPICLYPPAAAKMTRCGHIYCWSCILHYLALSEKSWSKCPICYEAVHNQDLKSVVAVPHPSFNVNQVITFKLMKRAQGSLIAYAADDCTTGEDAVFSVSDAGNAICKLLIANNQDIMSIIQREESELKVQMGEQLDESENPFLESALRMLKERENVLLSKLETSAEAGPSPPAGRQRFESSGSDLAPIEESDLLTQAAVKYFYFYQAADGQHIYLHSVNVRMLEHTYGSLEFSPKTISGRIVEKEGGSMTEELRNRLRCLQHLPVTCQFEVAEVQLHSSVISEETSHEFAEQLELRKKRRQKRARDEKRREKRIAEEECRQMGQVPEAHIELESQVQFPEFGTSPGAIGARKTSEPSEHSRSASPVNNSGPSFAKCMQSQPTWPRLKSDTTPSASTSANNISAARLINVTGSKLISKNKIRKEQPADSEPECDDYVPVPEYNRSFSEAIAIALEKASLDDANANTMNGRKKKSKKNKQKVLFATSMTYGVN